MNHEVVFFSVFTLFILTVLLIDLLVIGRKRHVLSTREATIWTAVWVSFAAIFYFFIYHYGDILHTIDSFSELQSVAAQYAPHLKFPTEDLQHGLEIYRKNMATEFITGYLIEYTLSLDNVFVILLILTGFSVPESNYKTVLFWGILGAVFMRFIFIFLGAAMVQKFQWTLIVFGVFLVYSGIKIYLERHKEQKIEVGNHPVVRTLSKYFRIYPDFKENKFFHREGGTFFITPLFIVLIVIEFTDLIFAFDSIPAIFSVTRDPYIVFFSNIFAIIGLRSLFFLVIKIFYLFRFLKEGIAVLLVFIGLKLVFHHWLDNIGYKSIYSLYVILLVLLGSIVLSLLFPVKKPFPLDSEIHIKNPGS
ncbi:MAG: TerC/Alx family metal homeostasis membrane protein [Bacteroidales bacterium]|nr:TerC/Alx family metal homeostasis membrane protein [Bacteroidales bacterium]MCB8998663.1 TerC/Alx family metal homeostasis membrane protein [Bacteroidales bacterium]MCB9012469.1 TerC/Alx family metal homeostasis membrane protein [Bacteroidales bacterium]